MGLQLSPLLPHVKFVFPSAPDQPVTINGGAMMPSWYDILSLSHIDAKDDEKGLKQSAADATEFIRKEVDAGIPASRIVIGGFSQGGAVSLLTGLQTEYKLAGIVGLSTYLPMSTKIFSMVSDANKTTPIFMGHGTADRVVNFDYGQRSAELLTKHKYNVTFKSYHGMDHSACDEEFADVAAFLKAKLP